MQSRQGCYPEVRKPSAPWAGAMAEHTPMVLDPGHCCLRADTRSLRVHTFTHLLIWCQGLLLAHVSWSPGKGGGIVVDRLPPHLCVDRMTSPMRARS